MPFGEEPKTVRTKKGEKMERYGKKQWLARRGSRLPKNGSGSQARTLVQLSLCKLSILVFPYTEKPIFEDWFN